MSSISELTNISQGKDAAVSALLQKHLLKAEAEYQSALVEFKDDIEECKRRTEFGLFRLELAKQQISVAQEKKFQPNFEENTPEHSALMLSGAITRTKMAVEYSNCVVSEPIRRNMVGIVQMFNEAVDMLKTKKPAMSKRTSEGGLLMLYLLERQIEMDNRQSIVDLKNIPKFTGKESKKIKDAVDLICNLREQCIESAHPVSARITKHLDAAVENFYIAVQAFVDDDIADIDRLTVTIRMQVEFAGRLFTSSSSTGATVFSADEEQDNLDQRLSDFKTRIMRLQRLVRNRTQRSEQASKRLDAALSYYSQALEAFRDCNLAEAERLISGALLDLDFAKQLLFSTGKPTYRDV